MITISDTRSKEYTTSQTAYKSHLDCNRSLSNSCPNMQSNLRRNETRSLQRPAGRSMRTFRSKLFDVSEDGAVQTRVTSDTANVKKKPYCSVEQEILEKAIDGKNAEDDGGDDATGTLFFDLSQAFSDFSAYSSDISGELLRLATATSSASVYNNNSNNNNNSNVPKEPVSQAQWVGRFVKSRHAEGEEQSQSQSNPQVSSTTRSGIISDSLEPEKLEIVVKALVEDLEPGTSIESQRNAAAELRLLAKHKMENRVFIASAGAIKPLVRLLHSTDPQTQENTVTALLNLSLYENNKIEITAAGAIKPLIYVLKTGTSIAKQNAACTLLSLSLIEDNKVTIGAAGAIPLLVALLINGSSRGKKDAATTLYTLSSLHQNKERAIRAGAIKPLVDLMADPSSGMVDKAVVVLSNLATVPDGKNTIVDEGGIPVLVEIVEVGSQKGKEFATATLLQLCADSYLYRTLVSREGAIPPLVALSQSGTTRAKQKTAGFFQMLLSSVLLGPILSFPG
eukprot:Gb_12143 [translate_table: standard]